tara:strand:+ start:3188 stop:3787 length:600 start_codon:yes stop_codon:yes gene_type:complete
MVDNEVLQNTLISIDELIEEHGGSRKEKITEVFDVIGERFATTPASTNLKYHSCYRGGLMVHTLNVLQGMLAINDALYGCDKESILIAGLFHDIGKIGSVFPSLPLYIDNDSQWHIEKLGMVYKYNPEINDCLTHSLRSIRILTQLNFPLLDNEFVAILTHDGWFEEANRAKEMMRCTFPLVKLLQHADQICTVNEKNE